MKIKVDFVAINQGNHGAPGTVLSRVYDSVNNVLHLPKEGDELIIQFGEDKAQSGSYIVKKITREFWKDSDALTYWVESH